MIKYWKKLVLLIIIGLFSGVILREIVEKHSIRTIKVLSGDALEITSYNKFLIMLAHNTSSIKTWKINLNDTTTRILLDGVDCTGLKLRKSICRGNEKTASVEDIDKISQQATEKLEKILSKHPKNITFKHKWVDKYGRHHGVLYAGSVNVNKYMLDKGGCWAKTTAAYEELKCMFPYKRKPQ